MNKLTLLAILCLSFSAVYPQQNILVFKKKDKVVSRFWEGSTIAFQLGNSQWQKGEITHIRHDSFYIRPVLIQRSLMTADTFHYSILGFALSDVYAMPKKGILIDYGNGRFHISTSGGHVHWYWIKSGWIFRVGAAGYAGLNIVNGIVQNNFSFSESAARLGIAAAVFLGGVFLHKLYTPTLRLGSNYNLKVFKLAE